MPTCPSCRGRSHAVLCVIERRICSTARFLCRPRALCSCTWEWRCFLVQTHPQYKVRCSEVSLEPGSYSKMCSGSEFPLNAMGFHNKNDRSNLSQVEWFLQQATYESCRLMLSLHTLPIATNSAFKSNCHYLLRDMFLLHVLQKRLCNSLYPFVVQSLLADPERLGYVCIPNRGLGTLQLQLASANVSH